MTILLFQYETGLKVQKLIIQNDLGKTFVEKMEETISSAPEVQTKGTLSDEELKKQQVSLEQFISVFIAVR